jgi:hypothetical protein
MPELQSRFSHMTLQASVIALSEARNPRMTRMEPANRVEQLVLEGIVDVTRTNRGEINRTDRILEDLRMDGDDFSLVFVPAIESQLGVKTKPADWTNAYTVQDVIDVFSTALPK